MNRTKFGVQTNYSYGGQRRKYNVGRYVANKYKSNRAYTRRLNVRKGIKSGETVFKLRDTLNVFPSTTSGNCYAFQSGQSFANLSTQIAACTQWATIAANWSLFRLNGMSIRVARTFNENIGSSLGLNTLPSPPLYINYYPSVTSQSYSGELIMSAESTFRVDPFVTGVQKKYISIPKNFSNLTNGIGLGTWNPVISIANLVGQISVGGDGTYGSAVTTHPSYEMIIVYYVSVCNDKA